MSDTSKEAWQAIQGCAPRLRQIVYDHIAKCGERGATCQEAETALSLCHETTSARINELVRCGAVADSGKRRLTRSGRSARVLVIARLAPPKTSQGDLF